METRKIYKADYAKVSDYRKAYKQAVREIGTIKAKIDDGRGGSGWMFFASREDYRTWMNQK